MSITTIHDISNRKSNYKEPPHFTKLCTGMELRYLRLRIYREVIIVLL